MRAIFTKTLLLALSLLACSLFSFSQTYTFSWGSSFSPAWIGGNTSKTSTAIGASGITASVSMSIVGTGVFGSGYPAVNFNNATSGVFKVQNSTDAIEVDVDFANKISKAQITITFSAPIQNFNFGISDIDGNGGSGPYNYLDSIRVSGTSPTGATVLPAITKYTASSAVINIDASDQVSAGNGTNVNAVNLGSPGQDGTAFFTFNGNAVTTITIDYTTKNVASVNANPSLEAMAIGNIVFDKALAPTTTNVTNLIIPNGAGQTAISGLMGSDDESIANYTVVSLPTAAMGVLYYYDGSSYVAVTAGQTLTTAQAASIRFAPSTTFSGNAMFTFTATDNRALGSNTSTFTIPVEPTPLPTANNITSPVMNNSFAQTAIPSLQASVSAGSIASYNIATLPSASAGVLYLCNPTCVAVTAGQTVAVADIAKLKFDPAATFTGNASFTYTATSNTGAVSNTAIYTLPVNNLPPTANSIISQVFNNAWGQTAIPALSGGDVDGTVVSYAVTTLPPASAGVLYFCNPTCAAVTTGQVITAANVDKLKFTPTAGYIGTGQFTYTSLDNNSNASVAATYSIPIKGVANINLPPYADNITAPQMINTAGATLIPNLVGYDADGTIANYTVQTIPVAVQGSLTYCSNGTEPCTGAVTAVAANTTLTAAQMATLKFTPATTFTGTASFTYTVKDNSNNVSNTANYSIPVTDVPPIANPIVVPTMVNTTGATAIPALSAHDPASISSYTISTLPSASAGVLTLCNPTCVAVIAGQTIAIADISKLKFAPLNTFTGAATFTYTATNNNGLVSNTTSYVIPVTGGAIPAGVSPVASNKTATVIANNAGATGLAALSATDADGTIANYTIASLPAANQGVLTLCNPSCATVIAGQVITTTDVANLKFTPTAGYVGNAVFDYTATDNSGKLSQVATYTVPVNGVPPVSKSIQATAIAKNGSQAGIASLNATDADGSVSNYVISSLPPSTSGVLYLCNPTCATVTVGQTVAVADASKLQFAPASTFPGIYTQFNYSAVDNSGKLSNLATYTIPMYVGVALPVNILRFGAEKSNEGQALLTWTTASEASCKKYLVERSLDGANFGAVGEVIALKKTSNDYSFVNDISSLATGKVYYRLQQVDADGKTTYSNIVSLMLNKQGSLSVQVTPNPVNGPVVMAIGSATSGIGMVRITDNGGRILLSKVITVTAGSTSYTLEAGQTLANGVYLLSLQLNGEVKNQRFVVQR